MEPSTPEKIVISPADLAQPHVDEQLASQLSFGMSDAHARVADAKTSALQRPWVALMLAGALGGLAGWGIIEPFFDDGTRLTGTIERTEGAMSSHLYGKLLVGGVTVWIPNAARIRRDGRTVPATELEAGLAVEVRGQLMEKQEGLVAQEVRIRGPGEPPVPVDLKALRLWGLLLGLLIFPVVASFVGLFVGAADGLLSKAFRRSAVFGLVGLGIGLGAGLIAAPLAEVIYNLGRHFTHDLQDPAGEFTTFGFLAQMVVRGIAWSIAGAAMGLGQGVALRSKKLALNGLLGGMVGALIGGMLFDPVDYLINGPSMSGGAAASRATGFAIIGAVTGLMIGVVELLAREAWVKLLTGPLAGKEFIIYKSPTLIGSSPKSDVYLFKDSEVEPTHAALHTVGEGYEIEDRDSPAGTFVNGRRVRRKRLENGDQIRIGKTVFNFAEKEA
ncbi:MAG: FHA domain-containing protein [Deltaproteobacteria bacterium]|nr:FHA domain-containing protein [Deltaproteobacteria bacterium]